MITSNSSFTFSHNDSKEPAKLCIARMNASKEISRDEFIAIVGQGALLQIESELGKEGHSYFKSIDENGNNIVYVDVQAIHYIFTENKVLH